MWTNLSVMLSGGFQILHVEDDAIEREAVARSLAKTDIAAPFTSASDGIEALEVLRANKAGPDVKPFLVLLDWKMPRMNGQEFLAELRSDPDLRQTVVFVLTTSADQRDVAAAYEQLVAAYIVKGSTGADFGRLASLLEAYLDVVELPA